MNSIEGTIAKQSSDIGVAVSEWGFVFDSVVEFYFIFVGSWDKNESERENVRGNSLVERERINWVAWFAKVNKSDWDLRWNAMKLIGETQRMCTNVQRWRGLYL